MVWERREEKSEREELSLVRAHLKVGIRVTVAYKTPFFVFR